MLNRKSLLSLVSLVSLFVAFAALAAPAPAAAEELSDTIHKSFPIRAGGTLALESDYGAVRIKTGSGSTVEVELYRRVRADSREEAQKIMDDFALESVGNGDKLTLDGVFKTGWEERGRGWESNDGSRHYGRHNDGPTMCDNGRCLKWARNLREFRWVITVPKQLNLSLHTRVGEVTVPEMDGSVRVRTAAGDVELGSATGDVEAHTAGGSIHIKDAKSANLETAGGSIDAGRIGGEVRASTAGGSINIDHAAGDVVAHTAGGSIEVATTGAVDAETVGGSVEVTFERQPEKDSRLKTMGGNVTVTLPANAHFDLDAETNRYGNIESDFPLNLPAGRVGDNATDIRAKVNGGGPIIRMRNQFGTIELRRR
jgi:hypothetical protein